VYYYELERGLTETEDDLLAEIPIPKRGDIIHRKGKAWLVSTVLTSDSSDIRTLVPVYRVFLT
jgi:hypothetical protein